VNSENKKSCAPKRVQRKRTKDWRMPPNTVYVGRPGPWGNPFAVKNAGTAERALALYKDWIDNEIAIAPDNLKEIKGQLRGKNLACWCKLGRPCHADVLLRLANEDG
jgi:hypothetical protein